MRIYRSCPKDIWKQSPFSFPTENEVSDIHFEEVNYCDEICLSYKSKKIETGSLSAFLFIEDMGQMNYAAINYSSGKNLESLDLDILFQNKYFHFHFVHLPFSNEEMLFNFIPLNIHHKYYIRGNKPWEYDNDALVTLCSRCHQKRHLQTNIPLYTSNRQLINPALSVCNRCVGTGYLLQYHYHMGGICFKCHGEGVYGYD